MQLLEEGASGFDVALPVAAVGQVVCLLVERSVAWGLFLGHSHCIFLDGDRNTYRVRLPRSSSSVTPVFCLAVFWGLLVVPSVVIAGRGLCSCALHQID